MSSNKEWIIRQDDLLRLLSATLGETLVDVATAARRANVNARPSCERYVLPEQLTEDMIRAALADRWPALYAETLYREGEDANMRAATANRVADLLMHYEAIRRAICTERTRRIER